MDFRVRVPCGARNLPGRRICSFLFQEIEPPVAFAIPPTVKSETPPEDGGHLKSIRVEGVYIVKF